MIFKRKDLIYEDIETETRNGGRYYKTPIGSFPSVTTVLSVQKNEGLDQWRKAVGEKEANRVTEEALRRGTKFHLLLENFLNNKPIENISYLMKSHFQQVKNFFINNINVIYGNEIPLYSSKLKVAGRCDCLAEINGKIHLIDFKTSKKYKNIEDVKSYFMQCSAYCFMIKERFDIEVKDFCVIISNLEENFPNYFYGRMEDHIKDFVKLRIQYKKEKENV